MKTKSNRLEQGFTIVELMIASSILAVLLLAATVTIMQITRLYFKGLNSARTQDAARTITDDVSRSIQFGGDQPKVGTALKTITSSPYSVANPLVINSYCIGTTRYSFTINKMLVDAGVSSDQAQHVLWRDTIKSGGSCDPLDLTVVLPSDANTDTSNPNNKGQELLSGLMRLTGFNICTQNACKPPLNGNDIYKVDVWVAYGGNDLLSAPDADGHRYCSTQAGSQFCATSELTTVVERRLR